MSEILGWERVAMDTAFVVMQVGAKDSSERKRADEVYKFIIEPSLAHLDLKPYRADMDASPGAITQKLLSELVQARIVIADLTGRNPNVYYELGITHSFTKPLICIADSVKSLPFDAKDERVIELGDYVETGLSYAQGETAKAQLGEALAIVLSNDYEPPSPLKELAANRSLDALAPENPVAAELAQMRETLDEVRTYVRKPRMQVPESVSRDLHALRRVIENNINVLDESDFSILNEAKPASKAQQDWISDLRNEWERRERSTFNPNDDPWGSAPRSDEPPF